jgi:hypothetical protein
MKRLLTIIAFILTLGLSTAFMPTDSTKVVVDPDTTTVAEIKVKFESPTFKVEEKTNVLEQYFNEQSMSNETLISILNSIEKKVPNMNVLPHEVKLNALEEEFGITKDDYVQTMGYQVRLTNWVNLLIFIFGVGALSYLLGNKRIKRGPDVVLKLSIGALLVVSLILMKSSLIGMTTALLNPTYQIIQQFVSLTG